MPPSSLASTWRHVSAGWAAHFVLNVRQSERGRAMHAGNMASTRPDKLRPAIVAECHDADCEGGRAERSGVNSDWNTRDEPGVLMMVEGRRWIYSEVLCINRLKSWHILG